VAALVGASAAGSAQPAALAAGYGTGLRLGALVALLGAVVVAGGSLRRRHRTA
jgi:hypothetical protein